jgi:hypothetical protein
LITYIESLQTRIDAPARRTDRNAWIAAISSMR